MKRRVQNPAAKAAPLPLPAGSGFGLVLCSVVLVPCEGPRPLKSLAQAEITGIWNKLHINPCAVWHRLKDRRQARVSETTLRFLQIEHIPSKRPFITTASMPTTSLHSLRCNTALNHGFTGCVSSLQLAWHPPPSAEPSRDSCPVAFR